MSLAALILVQVLTPRECLGRLAAEYGIEIRVQRLSQRVNVEPAAGQDRSPKESRADRRLRDVEFEKTQGPQVERSKPLWSLAYFCSPIHADAVPATEIRSKEARERPPFRLYNRKDAR